MSIFFDDDDGNFYGYGKSDWKKTEDPKEKDPSYYRGLLGAQEEESSQLDFLTNKQLAVYLWILQTAKAAHISPSVREIATEFGISPQRALQYLKALYRKAYIVREKNIFRGIYLRESHKDQDIFMFFVVDDVPMCSVSRGDLAFINLSKVLKKGHQCLCGKTGDVHLYDPKLHAEETKYRIVEIKPRLGLIRQRWFLDPSDVSCLKGEDSPTFV